jgi:hypothetical protein
MKKTARDWLADQKACIGLMGSQESADRLSDITEGFIDALRLLGIYSVKQAETAYKELRVAHDEAIKKAALGVTSTESGSESSPKREEKHHVYSIAIAPPDVKWSGNDIYRLIQSMRATNVTYPDVVNTLLNLFRPQEGDAHAG